MIERRDDELSRIYRDAEGPRPAQRVDDNILAASQRVAGARGRPAGFRFARRWGTPVALAATVLVTFTLALVVFERESGLDAMAPEARRTERPAGGLGQVLLARSIDGTARHSFISALDGIKALQPRMVFVVHRRQGISRIARL